MDTASGARFAMLLGMLAMNAAAIDPGVVKGVFVYNGKVHALQHVYAWQPPGQADELWVYVTDAEVPAAERFCGVKLVINPSKPNPKSLYGVLYAPEVAAFDVTGSVARWQRLLVGDKRVVGKLKYSSESPAWSLDVEFSAPVFGGSAKRSPARRR